MSVDPSVGKTIIDSGNSEKHVCGNTLDRQRGAEQGNTSPLCQGQPSGLPGTPAFFS